MNKIQVGFLMSYDYKLLKTSIPLVYPAADGIFIALDENFRTWTGGKFEVETAFFDWLGEIDTDSKIKIFRGNFYDPALSPMENEVRERRLLALEMGIGNWLVQVDSDEYFLNFDKFATDLHQYDSFLDNPAKNQVQVAAFLVNLYKYVEDGVLYVDGVRRQKLATNYPDYQTGRDTRKRIIYTKNLLLHESVSRTEEDIITKFQNWGHSDEVDLEKFLQKWRAVNSSNYSGYRNFFYLEPELWKKLGFVQGKTIREINKNLDTSSMIPSDLFIWKKNFGQWFKFLFK